MTVTRPGMGLIEADVPLPVVFIPIPDIGVRFAHSTKWRFPSFLLASLSELLALR